MIVSPTEELAELPGVHGGTGKPIAWRCFARRGMLFSEVEAFEYARLEPGGVIGEHTHTRSEEIYFIASGRGRLTLDGEVHAVARGDLVLLPLNGSHALVNDSDEHLEIVVVELLPPEVSSRLPPRKPVL